MNPQFLALGLILLGTACSDDEQFEPIEPDAAGLAPFFDATTLNPDLLSQGNVPVDRDARVDLPDVLPIGSSGACRTGQIAGTVCAPSGRPIAAAQVVATTRTCRGDDEVLQTTTDNRGYFTLTGYALLGIQWELFV